MEIVGRVHLRSPVVDMARPSSDAAYGDRLLPIGYRDCIVSNEFSGHNPPKRDDEPMAPLNNDGQGTFLSSVFMTFNSAVGTGILTLPYAFRCAGLYGGALMLLFYMVIELGCLAAIIHCTARSGSKSYPEVVEHLLGPRASRLFAGVVAVYCFFACTGGYIIIKNVLGPLVTLITDSHPWWSESWIQVLAAGVLVFPLLLLKSISSLRFSAMLSFAAVMFVVGAVVANSANASSNSEQPIGDLDYWPSWPGVVLAVPNVFLSLQCHIQVPSIYADLKPELKSVRRMVGAASAAYVLMGLLYGTMAVFGLISFHRLTKPNIMECDYDVHAWSIIMARICLTVTAIFSIPVNHHPAREAVWSLISAGSSKPMPQKVFMTETLCFFLLSLGCGCLVDELSTLNDLMGLSAGVAVIFVLPSCFLFCPDLPPAHAPPGLLILMEPKTLGRQIGA